MSHSTKRDLKSIRHNLSPVSNKIIRLASKHLTPPCPLAATDVATWVQPLFSFCCVRTPVKAVKRRTSFSAYIYTCRLLRVLAALPSLERTSRSFLVLFSLEFSVFLEQEHASIPLSVDRVSFGPVSVLISTIQKRRASIAHPEHGMQLTYTKIATTRAKR